MSVCTSHGSKFAGTEFTLSELAEHLTEDDLKWLKYNMYNYHDTEYSVDHDPICNCYNVHKGYFFYKCEVYSYKSSKDPLMIQINRSNDFECTRTSPYCPGLITIAYNPVDIAVLRHCSTFTFDLKTIELNNEVVLVECATQKYYCDVNVTEAPTKEDLKCDSNGDICECYQHGVCDVNVQYNCPNKKAAIDETPIDDLRVKVGDQILSSHIIALRDAIMMAESRREIPNTSPFNNDAEIGNIITAEQFQELCRRVNVTISNNVINQSEWYNGDHRNPRVTDYEYSERNLLDPSNFIKGRYIFANDINNIINQVKWIIKQCYCEDATNCGCEEQVMATTCEMLCYTQKPCDVNCTAKETCNPQCDNNYYHCNAYGMSPFSFCPANFYCPHCPENCVECKPDCQCDGPCDQCQQCTQCTCEQTCPDLNTCECQGPCPSKNICECQGPCQPECQCEGPCQPECLCQGPCQPECVCDGPCNPNSQPPPQPPQPIKPTSIQLQINSSSLADNSSSINREITANISYTVTVKPSNAEYDADNIKTSVDSASKVTCHTTSNRNISFSGISSMKDIGTSGSISGTAKASIATKVTNYTSNIILTSRLGSLQSSATTSPSCKPIFNPEDPPVINKISFNGNVGFSGTFTQYSRSNIYAFNITVNGSINFSGKNLTDAAEKSAASRLTVKLTGKFWYQIKYKQNGFDKQEKKEITLNTKTITGTSAQDFKFEIKQDTSNEIHQINSKGFTGTLEATLAKSQYVPTQLTTSSSVGGTIR